MDPAAAAATFPFRRGNGTATASSSPRRWWFQWYGGGGFNGFSSSTSGFPFPPSPSHAWYDLASASPMSPSFVRPPSWDPALDKDPYTPSGFMRYSGNQPHNFNLVGAPSHNTNVIFLIPMHQVRHLKSCQRSRILRLKVIMTMFGLRSGSYGQQKEDERLVSAWIENSMDSACGADRRTNAYWGDVIKSYKKNTPGDRKRNAKQAKDQWHKINKWCFLYECAYVKACRVFTSGYNDQMWADKADEFYLEDDKDQKLGPFMLKGAWKICRKVAKWKTYNEELKNAHKRKGYKLEEEGEGNDDTAKETPKRPMGQKAAKKAALAAKGKLKDEDGKSITSAVDVDKLDRLGKI